tara:strand:- start:1242 stop:1487 length:246 start_codon:yes stop_codon:yes gene_type:complete
MKCISSNIDNCIIIQRGLDDESVYVFCNMSNRSLNISPLRELSISASSSNKFLLDNITGTHYMNDKFNLNPYQVAWLTLTN